MLEKLQYDLSNYTDVEESIKLAKPKRLKKKNLKRSITRQHNTRYTIMDLVTIFTEEADKVCMNKDIANLIALESLNDYVNDHARDLKFTL